MLFRRKKIVPDIVNGLEQEKISTAWKLNIGFALVVVLSILVVGSTSFRMISESMLNHAKASSTELIKQTCRNLETILKGFDEIAMTLSQDDTIAQSIGEYDSLDDFHKKEATERKIREILDNRIKTRSDIIDIAVISNNGGYISSEILGPDVNQDITKCYAVSKFVESNKGSLWLNTYTTDVDSTYRYSKNGQVFSLMKGILSPSSLKVKGILLVNIDESYLYGIIADIKPSDDGKIFIVGSDGNYVLNPEDRSQNGAKVEYDFINDILGKGNACEIRKIGKKDYLITFQTIDQIKGTHLGWTVVEIAPVSSITTSVTRAGMRLFFIGLICVAVGFILIGFITKLYNTFLDKEYSERHAIALERERLASLGQLIGGIAHNFKTPIMSISGGLEAIMDLIKEYESSIGDSEVTIQDHHEIAAEMKDWVEKIRPYCSYMSDIISTVKGHTVNLNESSNASFTVEELLKRVNILMNHELKKYHCKMNVDLKVDINTVIPGEINNLIQVLNNLISNSIEAYNGEDGDIDLVIGKRGQELEIMVRDFGEGIPEKVKKKLLKEMITTKGKNGTGLGLYMSYSTIKGKFGGTMKIESEEGKGTVVYIYIPCSVKK